MILLRRLTIFAISIVGLSTTLIGIPITSRNANALSFDALVMDYSTWPENDSAANLLYLFKPDDILIPQPHSHAMTIDSGLNTSLEKNIKNSYIANDFIDLNENLFENNNFKLRLDSFDPSQIVVQKFTSIFLVFFFILISMLFFTSAGLVFIDKLVFRTILQNCFRSDRSFSWDRAKKEIKRFSQLVFKILVILVIYILFNSILILLCHEYIVPIPTVIKIFSAFDINPVVWEQNIEIGEFGDIGEEYEQWSKNKNFSPEMSRFWQEFLWNNWYFLIPLILYFGFSFYMTAFKFSLHVFRHYKEGASRRRLFYYHVDRNRTVKKKLETDQQALGVNNTQNASE